jgi:tRNA A-37 threonylcarbamoyl transferase component Bud32
MPDRDAVVRRVEALVAGARLLDAANVAAEARMHARAAELFEQACEFAQASDQASLAGDSRRALVLAALSGDEQRVMRGIDAIVAEPNRARAAAEELRARGHGGVSARVLDALGDKEEAALAYAEAGLAVAAADAYEAIGQPREAARVLETAHRADPQDHPVALRLASLLVAHRRFDAATRLLQGIPEASPLRSQVLPLLVSCYEALGFEEAAARARKQAAALGVTQEAEEAPRDSADAVERVVYGRYEIVRSVASTPSAQVFEAIDRVSGQRVAVKQLRSQSLQGAGRDAFERLTREARALAMLNHTNVVPLIELVDRAGAVITPWMAGGSLADLMSRERVTPSRAVEIACSVLGALAEAHRLGILHRDVKPSNILFDESGVARLADFGAAHVSDASHTATAGVIGTLAYMSPEQRLGMPATPASDVFGVGATLIEMLTGQPPTLSGQTPRVPSSCHPELDGGHDAAVRVLIESDARERVGDALEARQRLRGLRWPDVNRGALAPVVLGEERDKEDRLHALGGGLFLDRWLGRRVRLVPDSETMRRVAQAWALAGSRGLSAVLRHDAERAAIWFEESEGVRLSEAGRSLTAREGQVLAAALGALHERGVAHGRVDAGHVLLCDGVPVLVFDADAAMGGSVEGDLEGLRRLVG